MTFGKFPQRLLVYLALTTAAFAQTGSALFRLPGAGSNQSGLVAYSPASSLEVLTDTVGPLNGSQVIAVPHNQRFYVIGETGVQLLNVSNGSFQALNGVSGNIKSARLSPDAGYLMVMGDNFYVVNTYNNSVAAINLGSNDHTIVDVAFSIDSRTMFMLRSRLGEYSIASVDLANLTVTNTVSIALAGTAITMSPTGVLYVSAQDAIGEFKPATLELAGTIQVVGRPGPIRFSPDGARAYFANQTAEFGGRSIQTFRTAQRGVSGWPSASGVQSIPRFDDILVVATDEIYAVDRTTTTLWHISGNPLTGEIAQFPNIIDSTQVYAAAISEEQPVAQFLYVLGTRNGQLTIKRVNIDGGALSGERSVNNSQGILRYAPMASPFGAVSAIKIGDNQNLPVGGGTVRVAIRLLDSAGRPVYNHPALFATANSNVTISAKNVTTGIDGLAETYISLPGTPGTYTVSLIAASLSDSFQFRVLETDGGGGDNGGDGGNGGGGNGGGENGTGTIRAIRGDGMLIRAGDFSQFPLAVEIRDGDGDPVPQTGVEFQVISGTGYVDTFPVTTDENGRAEAFFGGGVLPFGMPFDRSIVRARSAYGDAEFTIVLFSVSQSSGIASIQVDTPPTFQVTGTRGTVIQNAFTARTMTRGTLQGVPGVSIRVASPNDFRADGPGVCVNDTHSGDDGISVCDLRVSCDAADVAPVQMVVGEAVLSTGIILTHSAGGRQLTLVSGNNQSGNAGANLNRLVAKVTDGCGSPVNGQDVQWTVTQGSATLTQVVSRSNAEGLVSAGVTLGGTAGQITVRVAIANASPVDFTLTTNVIINSVNLISGGNQSTSPGGAFTNPVVFEVRDNNGAPVGSGITVNFSVTGGASLGTASANTNGQGRVETTVTAGNNTGTVTVTASVSGKTATAELSVRPPTLPLSANSFTNAASHIPGLAPCGIGTLTGNGLAPAPGTFVSGVSAFGPWQYTVAGVSIRINGVPAPIQVVANQNGVQSVNFQTPCETQPGTATAVVSVNGTDTTVSNVPVMVAQPGIFTYSLDGKNYGAVIRIKDSSYITPSNPAPTGEEYYLILTGLGQATPNLVTNGAGLDQAVNLPMIVGVNNAGVPSQTARYLTANTGVYYIRFTIPSQVGVATGTILRDVPLAAAAVVNGQLVFGNGTLLPAIVQQ